MVQTVEKLAYKVELPRKWRIHDIFYVSPLKQNIIRKEQADKELEM